MSHFGRFSACLAFAGLAAIFSTASPADAGNYKGYAETGFIHANKRDCCEDAVYLAADDSALSCERAGGVPDYDPRRVRGSCDTDWRQDSRGRLRFSCRASVTVRCR